jgi:hypothetical protein
MDYFHKLAAGYELPPLHGVHCFVRTFPWTEEFKFNGTRFHYFEYDDMTDEAFIQSRIQFWTVIFEGLDAVKNEAKNKNV